MFLTLIGSQTIALGQIDAYCVATNKIGDASAGSLFGRSDVMNGLSGTTAQGTRIADGIADGSVGLNIVGDSLFNRAFGVGSDTVALARGNQIYLRSSSSSFLTDALHEGTHALDFLNGFGRNGASLRQWENRAWFYERQFQQWTGGSVDFGDVGDMFRHINANYPDVPFNPY